MSQSDCEQNSREEEKKPFYKFHLETIQKYIKANNDVCDNFYKLIDETLKDSICKQYDLKLLKKVQEDINNNFNKYIAIVNQINDKNIVINNNNKDEILDDSWILGHSLDIVLDSLYVIKTVRMKEADNYEWFEIESSISIYDLMHSNEAFTRAIQIFQNDI